jgi:hypothetical protein
MPSTSGAAYYVISLPSQPRFFRLFDIHRLLRPEPHGGHTYDFTDLAGLGAVRVSEGYESDVTRPPTNPLRVRTFHDLLLITLCLEAAPRHAVSLQTGLEGQQQGVKQLLLETAIWNDHHPGEFTYPL